MDEFQRFVQAYAAHYKAAPHAGTADQIPSTPYYTGPGGLWGSMGLEREVISTRVQGTGLAGRLPSKGSNVMYPMFAYFTGYQNGSGSNKSGVCDDPPTAGPGKNCYQTATFGRYEFQTRTLEINHIGQQINRGESTDLILMNDPLGDIRSNSGGIVAPSPVAAVNFRNELAMRMNELAIEFSNKLSRQVYQGNPANNTAGGGYKEFPGLDLLIRTGIKDAETGTACPTLDSLLLNYQFQDISTVNGTTGGGIVNLLTYTMRQLRNTAENTGLSPVTWALVMRETLFYELTALWPCNYLTARCTTLNNSTPNFDSADFIEMRDSMRNGNYLLIDGIQYPVILDPAIVELSNTTNSNVPNQSFASDIYIIPMTFLGNIAATYFEYYDYNQGPMQAVSEGNLGAYYWTDGGRYLFHTKTPINWCVQWMAKIEPRLIIRTPHLAARIRNIRYTPLMHTRDVFSDQPYFVNGGVTSGRTAPSLYNSW